MIEDMEQLKAENERLRYLLMQDEQGKNLEFAESLIDEGRLAPVVKDKAVELLNYASGYDNGEKLEFSENESLSQKVKAFLKAQPALVVFHEIATKERAATQDFSEMVQYSEDTPQEMIQLDQEIRTYAKVNKLSYLQAFNIITKKGK
ncbi:TPA: hypothetical protein QB248_001846 [Pasteurella multocida]|uniref:Uncharacterized protein n=2 Tax=Pasteurella multocida TaxID=747 RepID=A0A2Z4Q0J0_PASMD|nr:hypothetical protein [Pasteurella multocida]KUM14050.1 hypothetical protein ASV60_09155 [Pasteurella multocida]HDR1227684.1 hypothetical protein [Pasteurella multocida]